MTARTVTFTRSNGQLGIHLDGKSNTDSRPAYLHPLTALAMTLGVDEDDIELLQVVKDRNTGQHIAYAFTTN